MTAPLLLKWTDHLTKDGLDRFSTRFKFFEDNDLPASLELEEQVSVPVSEDEDALQKFNTGLTDYQ